MKAKRIHPQSSEGPFGLASLTWEVLLALTLNRCGLCFLQALLLSLASGIIKGHFFIWSSHSVLWGSAAKEVRVDCLRSGQPSLPLAPQNSCLLPFRVVIYSSNPAYLHTCTVTSPQSAQNFRDNWIPTTIFGGRNKARVLPCWNVLVCNRSMFSLSFLPAGISLPSFLFSVLISQAVWREVAKYLYFWSYLFLALNFIV